MEKIMSDVFRCIIPTYYGVKKLNGVEFIKMEHLTRDFPAKTAIMDVKLGSRTFLTSDGNNKLRNDLYRKV